MKNLKKLFILFLAFGVFAVGTVRAEELVSEEVVIENIPGIVVNDEGETIVENNQIVESDGEAEVEGDSYTVGADSLLDIALDTLPEDAVLAEDEDETYRDAEMVLEDDLEDKKEEKEANVLAILIVVVLIAAAAVAGIIVLGKKSKAVEIKKEEK